jgi:hypothetical protein
VILENQLIIKPAKEKIPVRRAAGAQNRGNMDFGAPEILGKQGKTGKNKQKQYKTFFHNQI